MGSGGGFAGFYFFEEPDDAYAEEAEEGEPAEDVDEGPVGGLALELTVEGGCGRVCGVGFAEVGGEGDGVDDLVLVDGAAAGEQRGGDGDADGAADVAHEVEYAGGVADLVVAE